MPDHLLQSSRRILTGSGVTATLGTAAGLGVLWALVHGAGLGPSPLSPLMPALLGGAAVLVALTFAVLWCVRPSRLVADLTVAAVATYVSGVVLLVLAGTPWGLYGLFGDQAFRTEAVTRFAQTIANVDHAYQGLPGHYPPLLPWLEARVAVLLDRPGWQLVKVGQILLTALTPVLSYWLWRRVATPSAAAAVVAVTTLFVANPYKIDQWLVLALLVPWWLDAFRGALRHGARAWPAWLHGIVAGLLLTVYTFYFVPMALATVAGIVVDVLRGRPWMRQLVRIGVIAGVGLVVSAWYWLPLALARLRGQPADDQQLRWFIPQHADVISPFEATAIGAVMTLGVVFAVAAFPRLRVAEGVALVAAAGYVVLGGGLVLTALGKPFLVFKTEDFISYALVAAAGLGIVAATRLVGRRLAGGRFGGVAPRAAAGLLTVVCLAGALQFVDSWAQGRPVDLAHATTLPSGASPRHAEEVEGDVPSAYQPEVSVSEITDALGVVPADDPVVVTDRVDLLATTAIHPFNTWWSIYSNPYGQFEERIEFLDDLSETTDPGEFARMAQQNPFDRIDGFVLQRSGDTWTLPVRVDNFPDGVRGHRIEFSPQQFDHPMWEATELGDTVVVTSLQD